MRRWIVGLVLALMPWQVWAAGYGIYEWSARGNALGGAMVARDADPSAVAYNPAAITDLPGDQFQLGFTAVAPSAAATARSSSRTRTWPRWTPSNTPTATAVGPRSSGPASSWCTCMPRT